MPWSTAISVGGSLLGGALGGSNKGAERAARDAAANAKYLQETQKRISNENFSPYLESGAEANRLLSQYLGTDTSGYGVPKPTLQQFLDKERNDHFNKYGKDYGRQANTVGAGLTAQANYQRALREWEDGLARYKAENANTGAMGDGRLLRDFNNEDFVKDPGYDFRMSEGEKGINRALSARGGFDSGSALKALARYNQDFASNEFGNAYNRDAANKQRIFNFLSGEKATGMGAASAMAGVGQNTANNMSNIGIKTAQQVGQLQNDRNMTYANAIQGAIGNLIYGMNRPRDSGVVSTPPWSTPPYAGYNNSAGNNWWSNNIG